MLQQAKKPHVVFESRSVPFVDTEGHTQYKDVTMAIITPAGGKDQVEKVAEDWIHDLQYKAQARGAFDQGADFYQEWYEFYSKAYAHFKQGLEMPTEGTSLKLFKTFTPAEIANCTALKIFTVEDLSTANEEALQRIGMGSRALKNKAMKVLEAQRGVAVAEENTALKQKVDELSAQVQKLLEAAPKVGRPRKELEAA